jgi:hypothetical protein
MQIKFGSDILKTRDHFQILGLDEGITLKLILRETADEGVNWINLA